MKAKGFQELLTQLEDLSEVQREALLSALKRKLGLDDAIELIDRQFKANPCCGHCGSKSVGGWSSQSGLARYRCKNCLKTFNALTGTPLAQLHRRDAWFEYAKAIADGLSLRKAAKRCGIALDTSFRWRHRFLKVPKNVKAQSVKALSKPTKPSSAHPPKARKNWLAGAPESAAPSQSPAYPEMTIPRC